MKNTVPSVSAAPAEEENQEGNVLPRPIGLTSDEAQARLEKNGPNSMPDASAHLLKSVLEKFWAPVPWLLEAAVILQLMEHEYIEAAVIAGLLIFNAGLAFFQESRAQATLVALKSRLALSASVRRDGAWKTVPAANLVVGDEVKLSLGGVVPADMRLVAGSVLLDTSMLTGESVPVETGAGASTYAGALVRRGEATALVTATGMRTKFGRTAELVRTAQSVSTQQKAVLRVVRNLALFNGVVILLLLVYALVHSMPRSEIIPLMLTAVLAAIPVALPATFTLAAAIGARALAKAGVLPTRLSAVGEAATMEVLCSDKTGTLTCNELSVTNVRAMSDLEESQILGLAALASSEGGQDPVDAAVRLVSSQKLAANLPKLTRFIPFDPGKKTAEADVVDAKGSIQHIIKGAFAVVAGKLNAPPSAAAAAEELEKKGYRVLAVAAGDPAAMRLIGLIALSDPPRADAAALISELNSLGVRTVMVTGDAPATAMIVAQTVGLKGSICPAGPLPGNIKPEDFSVFAGILPEDKFKLVQSFQKTGHTVGMCGDGANDAPALRQAQFGIAVSTATDVAKSAAGIVLTKPGLEGIVAAVKEGRITFQRILTYTLNSVIKKIAQILFLALGLLITGHAVLTPMLMVIVMVTGDFLSMSLTTDNVRPTPTPDTWKIDKITVAGVFLGLYFLAFCTTVMLVGKFELRLNTTALQTLSALSIVYGGQAMIYAIRERHHLLGLRPTLWLMVSSMADIVIISVLAVNGIAMAPLPLLIVAGLFGACLIFGFILSVVKIPIFAYLKVS